MSLINIQSKVIFAKTISGKFSNKIQAQKNPKFYAHINIYFRMLPWFLFKELALYSEQSFNHSPWSPYRQAVHKLSLRENLFILENYKIINSERIAGGGFNAKLLEEIKKDNLILRKGCEMIFKRRSDNTFLGRLKRKEQCSIEWKGEKTFLRSSVEINEKRFISLDEGFNSKTRRKVWGSEHGKLEFDRVN